MIININQKPTFDLEKIEIISLDVENRLCYVASAQVLEFVGVFGNLENRSRVLRVGKIENTLTIQVISATIDAGFCGKLVWKILLTKAGVTFCQNHSNLEIASALGGCQQIHLFQSPANNYYSGSNQTSLVPDIKFII
jgi:hypothetical protein